MPVTERANFLLRLLELAVLSKSDREYVVTELLRTLNVPVPKEQIN